MRLRSICDSEANDDPITSDLLTLAVTANIVQCSLLKRAGDVRYKTEAERKKGIPELASTVAQHVFRIARDLLFAPVLQTAPTLLALDAKDLRSAPSFEADGVMTSPPYLNGTNYVRNTKLELWFLRVIKDGVGLRELRDRRPMARGAPTDVCDLNASFGLLRAHRT